ncbi:MAG: hypothetical protein RL459_691 [Pseudomonadota bacterium]|jgi:ADP-L-glycero-D-manno-heptose 6-epimerase
MTRIVVTGAAGFIGSNLIKGLNARGIDDIIAVDDLSQGDKFLNLADLQIADYVDAADFYEAYAQGAYGQIEAIFHEGACGDDQGINGRQMIRNNYTLSVGLFHACQKRGTRLLYASSAAVYGTSNTCREAPECERPVNVYGYSKLLLDQRMRRECGADFARTLSGRISQVVGFRYFNVFGPREQHKVQQASLAYQQFQQFQTEGKVCLYGEHSGHEQGETAQDFVHVDDVVAVKLWFFDRPAHSGIYNLGSGRACPLTEMTTTVVNAVRRQRGEPELSLQDALAARLIEYRPLPEALRGKYPSYAQADLTALRATGCDHAFVDAQTGIKQYINSLASLT